jgi:hypothetical protein
MATYIITMVRTSQNEECTLGRMTFQGTEKDEGLEVVYTLERPGPDTTESGRRLRIPDGAYSMQWANVTGNGSLTGVLPLPWLFNSEVNANRGIYIHHGNFPEETDGCILVGLSQGKKAVENSRTALIRIKKYLNRVGIGNVQLMISSNYAKS